MVSALHFASRLLIPGFVLAYVLAMLASPCMPIADTAGEAQAIPRWEFWLLHASVPSAIGWQWTGGLQPITVSDRVPILVSAVIWLSICRMLGKWIASMDPVSCRLSKYEQIGVSILMGQSALCALVFLNGSLFDTHSLGWSLVWGIIIAIAVWQFCVRPSTKRSQIEIANVRPADMSSDVSFASSISRRMVGLLVLATTFLACIQVYGATIPTQDMSVREIQWWRAKHATLDGRTRWSENHAMANAPDSYSMPALAFSGLLTTDLWSIPSEPMESIEYRERLNSRLRISVLAGKTVNAILCLVGVFLTSVHVGRRWGYLPGLFVGFLLVATPGIAELTRLGRTEALTGIWIAALLVVWQAYRNSGPSKTSLGVIWGFLVAGAFSSGYGSAVLVGLPAVVLWIWTYLQRESNIATEAQTLKLDSGWPRRLVTTLNLVCICLAASAFYLRNVIASGDPIYPWGGVISQQLGLANPSDMRDTLVHAYRVPSESIFEWVADAAISDSTPFVSKVAKSPFRVIHFLDGVSRLLWNSNAHGLMLVPFAIIGILLARCWTSRLAIMWFAYWVAIWWCFSTRYDRDWIGALILLAWPAAAGANWMAMQARGYWMFALVSIAITWSVVVIPILPTSDNRIFVALQFLERNGSSFQGSNVKDSEVGVAPRFLDQLNFQLRHEDRLTSRPKILLIGENDDFDFTADCASNGPFDKGLLDRLVDMPAKAVGSSLRINGISHVLIVWSGVQYREQFTGRATESKYRTAIDDLLSESQILQIPWEINSSQAELFRVIE